MPNLRSPVGGYRSTGSWRESRAADTQSFRRGVLRVVPALVILIVAWSNTSLVLLGGAGILACRLEVWQTRMSAPPIPTVSILAARSIASYIPRISVSDFFGISDLRLSKILMLN